MKQQQVNNMKTKEFFKQIRDNVIEKFKSGFGYKKDHFNLEHPTKDHYI